MPDVMRLRNVTQQELLSNLHLPLPDRVYSHACFLASSLRVHALHAFSADQGGRAGGTHARQAPVRGEYQPRDSQSKRHSPPYILMHVSMHFMPSPQIKEAEREAGMRAKRQFVANISHEIRTPMNAILACTQLLQDGTNLTADQHELLQMISGCV